MFVRHVRHCSDAFGTTFARTKLIRTLAGAPVEGLNFHHRDGRVPWGKMRLERARKPHGRGEVRPVDFRRCITLEVNLSIARNDSHQ